MDRQLPLFDLELLAAKLTDAEEPGFMAEFDPDEADHLGAFPEPALNEPDAFGSADDLTLSLFAPRAR
jgi:hypothetical protein